jgi:hypothetical protein
MNKAEEILKTYVDFEDVNGSEPVTLLPLTIIDAMEEYATQCQEDMADKKYTEEDMYNCWQTAFTDAMNIREKDYKPIWFSDFINSLNKQD